MNKIDMDTITDIADLGDACIETRGSAPIGADEGSVDSYYLGAGLDRGE